jgi:hypothetical protein
MYKPATHPIFPHLVYLKDVNFKGWGSEGKEKTTRLYRLDWEGLDLLRQQQHAEWNKKHWPDIIVSIDFKLNSYYEDLLQSLKFAIPHHYMDEIHENTQKTVIEWNKERHFDTNIREMCLRPAIEYAHVAFELLYDCTFDEKTNYYLRAENKYILVHLLLYRFWMGQTGRGCVQKHAGFPELKEHLKYIVDRATIATMDTEAKSIDKLFQAIEEYEIKLNSCYAKIQKDLVGPSVGLIKKEKITEKAGKKNIDSAIPKPVFL